MPRPLRRLGRATNAPALPICIHCREPITRREPYTRYAVSATLAHVRCISFPSAGRTDQYLAAVAGRFAAAPDTPHPEA